MRNRMWIFNACILLGDIFSFILSFAIVYYIRFSSGIFKNGITQISIFIPVILFSLLLLTIISSSYRLYSQKRPLFDLKEFTSVFKAVSITFLLVIASTYLYKISVLFSRITITFTFIVTFILIVITRIILRKILGILRKWGLNVRNVLILGKGKTGEMIYRKIQAYPELGYKFIGFLDDYKKCLGKINDLDRIIKEYNIHVVFIALPRTDAEKINSIILMHDSLTFKFVPDVLETISEPIDFDEFKEIPLITLNEINVNRAYLRIKRIIDIFVAIILIACTFPFMLIISIIILAVQKQSPIFKQKRMGKDMKEFTFYKFKTMKNGKKPKNEVSYLFKSSKDNRITKFGALLRRTCLDELPQLFNVLKGDMSLVGPRPHLKEELHYFPGWRRKRFGVRPGMTGLWQISGRHELSLDKTVSLDIYYIKHISFLIDIKIILKTIPAIMFSRGKW